MPATLNPLTAEPTTLWPLVLRYRPGHNLADRNDFFAFCQDNAPLQIERTKYGEIIVNMPTGGESSTRNFELTGQLRDWVRRDGSGRGFDSNAGFDLPNGAMRAPDAAWVRNSRLATLTAQQKRQFLPLAPDFVVELRSETDSLTALQTKMNEYLDNGVALGLLLDPGTRRAWIYRPGTAVVEVTEPTTIDCSPELPGFLLDTAAIFDADL